MRGCELDEHEHVVVPALAALSVSDTVVAMQEWARKADAIECQPAPPDEMRTAHVSWLMDSAVRLDATLQPDGTLVITDPQGRVHTTHSRGLSTESGL